MSLIEQIYKQRIEFLRRQMEPAVIVAPYELRHQLIGEAVDHFGSYNFDSLSNLHILGMAVMFSHDCKRLEVLARVK